MLRYAPPLSPTGRSRRRHRRRSRKTAKPPRLELVANPDILATLSQAGNARPALVIGFAAETEHVVEHARKKRQAKRCDWILANDVSAATGTFGGDHNSIHLISESGVEDWPKLSKREVADRLADRIAAHFTAAS